MSRVNKVNNFRENIIEYSEERIIDKIPGPFLTSCSPYLTQKFSEKLEKFLYKYSASVCMKISKVIVIGDVSVGKTCLINRFCKKFFNGNYKSTIGVDFEVENFCILNVPYSLQIWDTAGQERFKSIAQSYYRGSHAVVIVFDLANPDTLYNCETWLKEASQTFSSKSPFIFLVGTKKDLVKSYAYKNMETCAVKMATKLNGEYWAVSSKTGKNIDNLFRRIAALTFEGSMKMELAAGESKEIGNNLTDLQPKKIISAKSGNCFSTKCP